MLAMASYLATMYIITGVLMFVTTIKSKQKGKVYETHLVRRTFRVKGEVRTETLANITKAARART